MYKEHFVSFGLQLQESFKVFTRHTDGLSEEMKRSIRYREESIELALSYYFASEKYKIPMWRIQSKTAFFLDLFQDTQELTGKIEDIFDHYLTTKGRYMKVNSDFSILSEDLSSQFPVDLIVEIKSELRTGLRIKSIFEDLVLVHMYGMAGAKEAYSLVVTFQSENELKERLVAHFEKHFASKDSNMLTIDRLLENLIVIKCERQAN
jgi:hypothetical protein